jgi:Skp family chaperone for outer membrane proteins
MRSKRKQPGARLSKRSEDVTSFIATTRKQPVDAIAFHDANTKQVYFLKRKNFEEELQKIYDKISSALTRVQKIGNYQLNEIEISVGMSSGILVLTLEGGITFRYSKITK